MRVKRCQLLSVGSRSEAGRQISGGSAGVWPANVFLRHDAVERGDADGHIVSAPGSSEHDRIHVRQSAWASHIQMLLTTFFKVSLRDE